MTIEIKVGCVQAGDVVVAECSQGIIIGQVRKRIQHQSDLLQYDVDTLEPGTTRVFHQAILWDDIEIMRSINERRKFLQRRF